MFFGQLDQFFLINVITIQILWDHYDKIWSNGIIYGVQ